MKNLRNSGRFEMNKKAIYFLPTIEVILLETYTFVIETKQLYNGRNRKYYNSRYSSRSGDGRIQWLSCTRPLSVRNLPIEVQWRGARATCRRPDDCPQRKTGRENSTFRRFSRKGHLYRIGLCGAEYTTEQLRHERATFPISQSYHVPDYRTARAMSPGFEQVEYRLRNTDHHSIAICLSPPHRC